MEDNIDEIVVEGLTPEDFSLLQEVIEKMPITIDSGRYDEIYKLYKKISEIVTFLSAD